MAGQTISRASQKYWDTMGVLTLTCYIYIAKSGKIVADMWVCLLYHLDASVMLIYFSHDDMANLAGSQQWRFIDEFSEEVHNIQRKLIEYGKVILRPRGVNTTASIAKWLHLEIQTTGGFPLMPAIMAPLEENKNDLEDLLQCYLSAHYSKR